MTYGFSAGQSISKHAALMSLELVIYKSQLIISKISWINFTDRKITMFAQATAFSFRN